ncbi:MAG: hypothetical protein RL030_1764 [Pseudomonadota bacterium]|jgi:DNA-binding NarL/FixJ family response regulator
MNGVPSIKRRLPPGSASDIVTCFLAGFSDREIDLMLGVCESTVRSRINRLAKAYGVKTRVQLAFILGRLEAQAELRRHGVLS